MTNRERFAVKICNATQKTNFACKEAKCVGKGLCAYCYTMADHLLANGVILPPCKVGQTVWVIPKGLHEVCKATIVRIEYNYYSSPQEWLVVEYVSSIVGIQEYKSRIDLMLGKTVFLTKEEAEEKLKELKDNA